MDAMIEQTINGLLGGFHAITVTDPAIKKEIEDYEQELRDLGEKSGDVSAFMTELQSSGLLVWQWQLQLFAMDRQSLVSGRKSL